MNLREVVRRSSFIGPALLAVAIVALLLVGNINEAYCTFGFGGFQCVEPYVGWGETLLTVMLLLIGLIAILVFGLAWRAFRWWRSRRA